MLKELEISGTGVLGFYILVAVLVIGLIYFFRKKYSGYSIDDLKENNQGNKDADLSSRTKFPEVDNFKLSGSFVNFGLAVAMAISLVTMSWTIYDKTIVITDEMMDFDDEVEVEIPRTAEPPPPPPPPPPPVIQEVPDEVQVEETKFESQDVQEETTVKAPVASNAPPPPPPPPPPPKEEEIFKKVEQMPRFPGCEDMKGSDAEKEECAKKKLLEFIYGNLKYPAIARENGVEGNVVIQFVVDKDGSVKDINVVRDIGAGCGTAAETAVKAMNSMGKKWTPGKQLGRPVKVLYTLPIRFKLE
ncbi:MAG: energy transducer TonB [Saprospiraceae bacterium]